MKDAVATMGDILPPEAGGRDAVHVAVFSATSAEKLYPGQHVAIVPREGDADAHVKSVGETAGIVDPFIRHPIPAGERFWVYLYPRTITGLSHRWSHPAFEQAAETYAPPSSKLASEQWLKNFVQDRDCPSYEVVLGEASKWWDDRSDNWSDEYLHFNGSDARGEIPAEFWHHIGVILGRPMQDEKRDKPTYFSCAC